MRGVRVAGVLGVVMLASVLMAPGAQAGVLSQSASCSLSASLTFKPALVQGTNTFEFIKMRIKLRDCTGGTVLGGKGYGGSAGTLRCDAGSVTGRPSAKMQIFWSGGQDSSGMNGRFNFRRSILHGKVSGGTFKGEHFDLTNFTLSNQDGDCTTTPLAHATMTGTLNL